MTISRERPQPASADADAPQRTLGAGIVPGAFGAATVPEAPSAAIVPGAPSAAIVIGALGATRRRIRLTLRVRAASVAGPAGIAIGAAGALLPLGGPLWLPLLLGSAGLAGAAAWAISRTPTLGNTASALDTTLDLRDRTAAAYQLHGSASPVARLVVHDAARRLATLSVATAFPFAVPRAALILAPLAVMLATALAWPLPAQDRAQRGIASGAGAGTQQPAPNSNGAATARDTAAGNSAARDADGTRRASESPEASPPPQPPGRARNPDGPGPRPDDTPSRGGQMAIRGRDAAPPTSREERTDEQQPRAGGPAPAPPTYRDAAIAAAAAAAASQEGRGFRNPTRSPQAGPVVSGRGGRGAPDADAIPSANAARGAGGVSQGALTALPRLASTGFTTSPAPAGLTTRYGVARAEAEAALTRDMVPPDLRGYVREYFRAIAPVGQR